MSIGGEHERRADAAGLRISDSDRDRIASVLGQHMAEGRLTIEELDERLGVLYTSQTRDQAKSVVAGLPALTAAETHHHWHRGHQYDQALPLLPDWLSIVEPVRAFAPSSGPTPMVAGVPNAGVVLPVPTDDEMQVAYKAWRGAVTKAKASKAAHKRAEAADDKEEAFRQLRKRAICKAEENSARAKFDRLRRLRPDWTSAAR